MPNTITVTITNKKGLHARAAAKFVKVVASCEAQVFVIKEGDSATVPGDSILGLMMLGADAGSELHISAEGAQAPVVLDALRKLVESRFGEGE